MAMVPYHRPPWTGAAVPCEAAAEAGAQNPVAAAEAESPAAAVPREVAAREAAVRSQGGVAT